MWSDHTAALFEDLQNCSPCQRAARLDELGRKDPALRAELESLLAAAQQAAGFLSVPTPEPSLVGERVGVYRLTRELGHGGMGTVYLAQRDDGHFRQQVAVKLIRPGVDAARWVERFRMERQILADLRHPHIAALLDGGSRDNGQPYLVLEYIEGQPLDGYCRSGSPSLERRLELFVRICRAVAHAHGQGVIHRDLKPANILVTTTGEPKLLDFGVARLMDPAAGLTRTDPAPMTPAYAAPEQMRGEMATPATDVYALGLILSELLEGCRSSGGPHRDLQAIAARAQAQDPARRYPSAASLADAVAAQRSGSSSQGKWIWVRWSSLLRRHRFPVALVGMLITALLVAVQDLHRFDTADADESSDRWYCDGILEQYRRSQSTNFLARLTRCQLQAARHLNDNGHHQAALMVLSELRAEYQQHPGRRPRMLGEQKGKLLAELDRAVQADGSGGTHGPQQ